MSGLLLDTSGSTWQAFFSHPEVAGPGLLMAMIVLIMAIPIITSAWVKVSRTRADASLKQSMVERGMSVEEIERVLAAKSPEK